MSKREKVIIPILALILAFSLIIGVVVVIGSSGKKYGENQLKVYAEDLKENFVISFKSKDYTCSVENSEYIHIYKDDKEIFKGTIDTKDGFENWKNYDSLGSVVASEQRDNIGYHCIHYVVTEESLEEYKEQVESFKNGYSDEQLKEMGIVVQDSALDIDSIGGAQDIYLYYIELNEGGKTLYFYLETLDSDMHEEDFDNINFNRVSAETE